MPRPKNNNLLQFYENNNNHIICNNGNCRGKQLNRHSANLQRHLRTRHNNLYVKYMKQIHTLKKETAKAPRGKRKRTNQKTEDTTDDKDDIRMDRVAVDLAAMIKTENSNGPATAPPPTAATPSAATTTHSEHLEEQPQQQQQQQQQQFDATDKLSTSSFNGLPLMFSSFVDQNSTTPTESYRLLEQSRRQEEEEETSVLNFFKSCLPDYKRLTKSKQRKLKEFFIKKLNEMLDEAEVESGLH